ncbi:hypothetical protein GIB67_000141 [Kingdonia uniflora]|uniref:Uncharacterized protein n=1 Tax=Kingdonia uniflora TaxID=39325 RepID=A0A7J7P9E4_9MAGN|nr:hypothetical protein GIB67_000141 [Kingdonia uniflora]
MPGGGGGGGGNAGNVVLRFSAFIGAGVICTTSINLWRDFQRKAALKSAADKQLATTTSAGAAE